MLSFTLYSFFEGLRTSSYSSYYDYIQLISALISWLQCNSPLPVWLSQGIPMYNSNLVKKRDLFKTPLNNKCLWRNIAIITNANLLFWTFLSFMQFERQWISLKHVFRNVVYLNELWHIWQRWCACLNAFVPLFFLSLSITYLSGHIKLSSWNKHKSFRNRN